MKKIIIIIILILVLSFIFYFYNMKGFFVVPENSKFNTNLPPSLIKNQNLELNLPDGFSISIFAKVPGVRVMKFDIDGNLWVSQTSKGQISKLVLKNGELQSQKIIFDGLQKPHGLAFEAGNMNNLYIAEENKISKVDVSSETKKLQKIIDLPKGGIHFTRTLNFGPDGRLYVSLGSTCNVCNESNQLYASIFSLNKDGSDIKLLAKGLRNSVFFIFNKSDKKIWATEMGRDLLGDNIPPDEINIIDPQSSSVLNYGWPICYGKNIHDERFDKNTYIRNPCMEPLEKESFLDIEAHSAPLGLVFVPDDINWPKEYLNNLIVALHGSWNRAEPSGYKLVRYVFDDEKNILQQEDFVIGWLDSNKVIGRPVDVIFDDVGNLYVTDDKEGLVYKITYNN